MCRLDHGNATLSGLPQSTLAPLQRVLNAAARLVCDLRPREHVTSALIDLHWLPIAARIEFKICMQHASVQVVEQYCTSVHFRHAAASLFTSTSN